MERLIDQLNRKKMCLIVSLPWDSYDLAKKVWEAGADAIKVHINVFHGASKHQFGTLEENIETFKRILKDSPVPVGIVPGTIAGEGEKLVEPIIDLGFDFISLYSENMPASLLTEKRISKFFSVNPTYTLPEIEEIAQSKYVDMLEMAFSKVESPDERLSARDCLWYEAICKKAIMPTILPTQHKVVPEDCKLLHEIGVKAVMIGAIVTSNDEAMVIQKTKEFRKAIDEL